MQLQVLEQNLQQLNLQKQGFQAQIIEIEAAIEELNKKPKQTFKIVGSIMIETPSKELEKDLNSKKEISNLKIKSIERHEEKLKEDTKNIRDSVLKEIEDE